MISDHKSLICALSLLTSILFSIGCGDGLGVLTKKSIPPYIPESNSVKQYISGEITTNTTLSPDVQVTGDLIINGATLTIQPGSRIELEVTNDNVVYGSVNQITIVALNGGAIQANGTAAEPILFTSASATPAAGDWDRIRFIANGTNSSMTYCIIEYAFNGICIENPAGITGASTPVVDHVTVRHASGAAMYATDASDVQITNCVIYDCESGVFFHGAASAGISNTLIYDVSAGIILAGDAAKSTLDVAVNHLTIYNVDSSLSSSPTWWTGYGIFTCNDPSTLTLTNSIIMNPTDYGLYCEGTWTITEDFNCFFGGIGSKENGGAVGANSIELDPVFTDASAHDFTLSGSSPCLNAAGDGSNMGIN
jgi:hypothetical protein